MKKPLVPPVADPALAIRVYMLAEGLTQKDLAERMGYTEASLSRKIRGIRKWTLNDVISISNALRLSDEEVVQIFLRPKKAQ